MTATRSMSQAFCCTLQYPGKKAVMYGTVIADANAPRHEVESTLRADVLERLPDGFTITRVVPGAIFFKPQGEGWDI